ncbi:MAG: hypothetical protein ACRDJU_09450 [Actinomycetota bacterium]
MSIKVGFGIVVAAIAGLALFALKPWKSRQRAASSFGPGARLRNDQGVGPSHVEGVPRGEEQALRNGSQELTSVAGRIAGSVDPQ